MILFFTSRKGFENSIDMIKQNHWPVWLTKGILTKEEIVKIRNKGIELTEFNYEIDNKDKNKIEEALYTIQEHHPEDQILVERRVEL